jgi:hypothetical protein
MTKGSSGTGALGSKEKSWAIKEFTASKNSRPRQIGINLFIKIFVWLCKKQRYETIDEPV